MLWVEFLRRALVVPILSLGLLQGAANAAQAGADKAFTIDEVVKLTKAGFSEDLIITKIKKNAKPYDLSTDELIELKKVGVTDNVIRYLLDPSQPYAPPPPVTVAPPVPPVGTTVSPANDSVKKYPADAFAPQVPLEPGLYVFTSPTPARSDLKLLLGTEAPKTMVKKAKVLAYLVGPEAKVKVSQPRPSVYVRLPEGHEIQELVLIAMSPKAGRREVQFGSLAPKQQFKPESMRQFESAEVGPHLFDLTPAALDEGEYLFFFLGSADPSKGIYGKGYDFGVAEPKPNKP